MWTNLIFHLCGSRGENANFDHIYKCISYFDHTFPSVKMCFVWTLNSLFPNMWRVCLYVGAIQLRVFRKFFQLFSTGVSVFVIKALISGTLDYYNSLLRSCSRYNILIYV